MGLKNFLSDWKTVFFGGLTVCSPLAWNMVVDSEVSSMSSYSVRFEDRNKNGLKDQVVREAYVEEGLIYDRVAYIEHVYYAHEGEEGVVYLFEASLCPED